VKAALIGLSVLCCAAARAADAGVPTPPAVPKRPLWELGLGVAGLRANDYRGSDETSAYLLPLPYVVYRGKWLRADRDGARAVLFDTEHAEMDVSLYGGVPARSRSNAARKGMPDLPPTVEVGPNLKISLLGSRDRRAQLELRLPLRTAITVQRSAHTIGTTFTPHLNLDLRDVAGGWNVSLLTGPVIASQRYHAHFYGVDAAYATPQRPAYRAPGGYGGWQALASTSRRIGPAWVGAFVRYDNLRGAVFNASPLVRSDHALMIGAGVSWVLATSSELVASDD
jgi:MipA family protein